MSRSTYFTRATMAVAATAGLIFTATPAFAIDADEGRGGPGNIYCLAPDGKIEAVTPVYREGILTPDNWYVFLHTPLGMPTPLPLYGANYSIHPTAGGTIDPTHLMELQALTQPGQTTQQSNTGDIPFVGSAFRAGDDDADDNLFTLFVGPSRDTINEICEGEFYDALGNKRPASAMNWSPKYVETADGFIQPSLPGGGNGGGGSSLSS